MEVIKKIMSLANSKKQTLKEKIYSAPKAKKTTPGTVYKTIEKVVVKKVAKKK